MKKLLFGLIAIVMFGFVGNAQSSNKVKLGCVITSCCSFGIFTIEIISTKHCFSVASYRSVSPEDSYYLQLEGENAVGLNEIEVVEDVILPHLQDANGEAMILEKGKYLVNEKGEVHYTPVSSKIKIKKVCIEEHVTGHVLGFEVDYTISMCAYYLSFRTSIGAVSITPKLTESQKSDIVKNNNVVRIDKDYSYNLGDVKYTLKAGDYNLNNDGSIYVINTKFN